MTIVATLLMAAPAGARERHSCAARGSETLRENSVARVYGTAAGDVVACSRRTGHREVLAAAESDERLWQLRLRGHYTAFAYEFCVDALGDDCHLGVARVNARSGAYRRMGSVAWEVVRVELRRTGGVAWSEDEQVAAAVYRHDRDGLRRLERARGLKPASLRLRAATLTWVTNGTRRRAPLR